MAVSPPPSKNAIGMDILSWVLRHGKTVFDVQNVFEDHFGQLQLRASTKGGARVFSMFSGTKNSFSIFKMYLTDHFGQLQLGASYKGGEGVVAPPPQKIQKIQYVCPFLGFKARENHF